MRTTILLALASFFLLSCAGCQKSTVARAHVLREYRYGELNEAQQKHSELSGALMPEERYTRSREAVWLLLDRGILHLTADEAPEAVEAFRLALEAIDFYKQKAVEEEAGQLLVDDRVRAYAAAPFEESLARIYLALSLWQVGDEGNAYAVLRQTENLEEPIGLDKALFASACARKGDSSNARILSKQAEERGCALPSRGSDRSRALLILVAHNGAVPLKASETVPGSELAGFLVEQILASAGKEPAVSSLTGVPVPILQHDPFLAAHPLHVNLDEFDTPLLEACPVAQLAEQQLEEDFPAIATRAVVRLLLRRGAVGLAQKKDSTLGAIADLAALIANLYNEADTRSWGTLPARIDVTMEELPPGQHTLHVDSGAGWRGPWILDLPAGSLCVVHYFTRYPGDDLVIIPDNYFVHFKDKEPL